MNDYLPPVEDMLTYEPGVVALGLIKYLYSRAEHDYLVNPVWLYSGNAIVAYTGSFNSQQVSRALNEAYQWLMNEGMISLLGTDGGNWHFITRKGISVAEQAGDVSDVFNNAKLLPADNLDPVLKSKVRPLYIAKDYDTAVFRAFKEVEVRTRKYAKFDNSVHGVDVTNKAFKTGTGPLSDKSLPEPEQDAMRFMFSGALGLLRNPSGHRDVQYDEPSEVAEMILLANLLLRILERRKPRRPKISGEDWLLDA